MDPIKSIGFEFKNAENQFYHESIFNEKFIDKSGSLVTLELIINKTLYSFNLGVTKA